MSDQPSPGTPAPPGGKQPVVQPQSQPPPDQPPYTALIEETSEGIQQAN
jgi:hypothetical protein